MANYVDGFVLPILFQESLMKQVREKLLKSLGKTPIIQGLVHGIRFIPYL